MNILNMDNEEYPQKLRTIKNPPQKLYYKGNIKLLKKASIAVIGSRNISNYGKNAEKRIVKELALRDIVIVSRNGNWCR